MKKDEFPDAFALAALEKYAGEIKHSIIVLSQDPDMAGYESEAISCQDCGEYVSKKLAEGHALSALDEKLKEEKASLEEDIKKQVADYLDDFRLYLTCLRLMDVSDHSVREVEVEKDKVLLITGGTGSFGNAVLNRFLRTDIGEIRIFSRDEKKQDDMRHDFQARMPEVANKIKFYIGDVRNKSTLKYAMKGVDYVFHAAALKQVPSCEFFPMEAVKTNVIGTDNTLDAAIDAGVKCVICLSTDKAAYPINAMGITKAIEEKIAVAKSRLSGDTKICCTRYGNVMCSRGSVIPLWIDQIRKGNPITLTEPKMTRFIMSLKRLLTWCSLPSSMARMVTSLFRKLLLAPSRHRQRLFVSCLVARRRKSK